MAYVHVYCRSQENDAKLLKFSFEMASIGRLLHATIVVHEAGFQMANSDPMAIHGIRNDKDFSLGTDCLPFTQLEWSLYLLHNN